MSMSIFTGAFWKAAAERAIKSVAYGALSIIVGSGTGLLDTNWVGVLSVSVMAGIISVLGSIVSDAATGGTGPSLTSAEVMTKQ